MVQAVVQEEDQIQQVDQERQEQEILHQFHHHKVIQEEYSQLHQEQEVEQEVVLEVQVEMVLQVVDQVLLAVLVAQELQLVFRLHQLFMLEVEVAVLTLMQVLAVQEEVV